MTSTPIRSALWCVPVGSVFRLEVQVAGKLGTRDGLYELEYMRFGEKWVMEVTHNRVFGFAIALQARDSVKAFTYKPYVRTNDQDVLYGTPNSFMEKGIKHETCILGAEVTVPQPAYSTSSWNFESSEQTENWDVILCVGDAKFYAHRTILSFASSTFRSLFEEDFREKNQQEIPVNVERTDARHFEAFLQCLYPGGSEPKAEFIVQLITLADFYNVQPVIDKCVAMLKFTPTVSSVDKLRIAAKFKSTSLEDAVVATLSKSDIDELIAADFKDLDAACWQKIVAKCRTMIQ